MQSCSLWLQQGEEWWASSWGSCWKLCDPLKVCWLNQWELWRAVDLSSAYKAIFAINPWNQCSRAWQISSWDIFMEPYIPNDCTTLYEWAHCGSLYSAIHYVSDIFWQQSGTIVCMWSHFLWMQLICFQYFLAERWRIVPNGIDFTFIIRLNTYESSNHLQIEKQGDK